MFVCVGTYLREVTVDDDELIAAHRAYLDDCYARDLILASGPRRPATGGVIVIRSEDRELAERLVAADPFVIAGLSHYDVLEFRATKAARLEYLDKA